MRELPSTRTLRSVRSETYKDAPNAALLIDFDNVTMGIRSDLQSQLHRLLNSDIIKGKVSVQRAYADWRRYPQYIVPLSEASIDLIFAPAFGANKKNATDIRLAIDALELVFIRPEIGTFILLSGDSDFSALVLKLKEYGKFVIGVGIRESASDLLVQNCDEYYSYNELTGLAKEGEAEHVRRDPWELAVAAVQQMEADDDVMRSDRLKQVMQKIDPNFDEHDAGFNRFSKFVVGAAQRGLLEISKMENGQYSVALGSNANVTPRVTAPPAKEPESQTRKERSRERLAEQSVVDALTLSQSFDLLKQALVKLEAFGENATTADRAREELLGRLSEDKKTQLEPKRFQRLLRQAHDANLIELVKDEEAGYLLKLSPSAMEEPDRSVKETEDESTEAKGATKRSRGRGRTRTASKRSVTRVAAHHNEVDALDATTPAAPEPEASAASGEAAPKTKRAKRSRSKRTTARTDQATTAAEPRAPARTPAAAEPPARTVAVDAEEPRQAASERKRNPRYRKGSKDGRVPPKPTGSAESAETGAVEKAAPPATHGARTVGARTGIRGARIRPVAAAQGEPAKPPAPPSPAPPPAPAATESRKTEAAVPQPTPDRAAAESQAPAPESGFLRRVTAAIQKAIGGGEGQDSSGQ